MRTERRGRKGTRALVFPISGPAKQPAVTGAPTDLPPWPPRAGTGSCRPPGGEKAQPGNGNRVEAEA